MTVISVKAVNFKKLTELDIKPNGKSFFVIGDTREGKSTLLKIIMSSLMLEDFPKDPLTTGAKAGYIETVHELDGMKYTITRKFTDKPGEKTRFTVKDQNGMSQSLEPLLERIFGKAFTNAYFDYNQFFFQNKTSDTRFNYMVKAMGGEQVLINKEKEKALKKERGRLGTEVERYLAVVEHSSLNPDTLERDLAFYTEERTYDEAKNKKKEILDTRVKVTNIKNQLNIVKEANSAYEISEENIVGIDEEIKELEQKILELKESRAQVVKWQIDNPCDINLQVTLEKELSELDETNKKIELEADQAYEDLILEINTYNNMRNELHTALTAYDQYVKYKDEWTEKDDEIKKLVEENKKIFSDRLPIPGMTIEDVDDKPVLMYNDREFCWENISKGESIKITLDIQRALNPKGNNLIVIPEAQSMGSDLDEVLEACQEHNIQAIVEVTERKQKFKIEFAEDVMK